MRGDRERVWAPHVEREKVGGAMKTRTGESNPRPLQYSPPSEQGERYEESSMMVLQKMITGKTGKEE